MKRLQLVFFTFLLGWTTIGTADSINHDNNDYSITDFETVSEAVDSIKATLENKVWKWLA